MWLLVYVTAKWQVNNLPKGEATKMASECTGKERELEDIVKRISKIPTTEWRRSRFDNRTDYRAHYDGDEVELTSADSKYYPGSGCPDTYHWYSLSIKNKQIGLDKSYITSNRCGWWGFVPSKLGSLISKIDDLF